MNSVNLTGRFTATPELKTTNNGVSVTSFTLAVDRNYTPKGEEKQADFISCVAWRNTAEFITKYFNKGDMVAITGEIQTRKYTDKEGNNRTAFEVVADQASFCGGKNNRADVTIADGSLAGYEQTYSDNAMSDIDDDDLPF